MTELPHAEAAAREGAAWHYEQAAQILLGVPAKADVLEQIYHAPVLSELAWAEASPVDLCWISAVSEVLVKGLLQQNLKPVFHDPAELRRWRQKVDGQAPGADQPSTLLVPSVPIGIRNVPRLEQSLHFPVDQVIEGPR